MKIGNFSYEENVSWDFTNSVRALSSLNTMQKHRRGQVQVEIIHVFSNQLVITDNLVLLYDLTAPDFQRCLVTITLEPDAKLLERYERLKGIKTAGGLPCEMEGLISSVRSIYWNKSYSKNSIAKVFPSIHTASNLDFFEKTIRGIKRFAKNNLISEREYCL